MEVHGIDPFKPSLVKFVLTPFATNRKTSRVHITIHACSISKLPDSVQSISEKYLANEYTHDWNWKKRIFTVIFSNIICSSENEWTKSVLNFCSRFLPLRGPGESSTAVF